VSLTTLTALDFFCLFLFFSSVDVMITIL
jgi:hypothetical protein